MSGWETLISSFGLPASNPHVIPRLGNLKPQEVSDPKKDRRITREPQEGRRKSDLAATFLRPSEEVRASHQLNQTTLMEPLGGSDSAAEPLTRRDKYQVVMVTPAETAR